MSTVINTSDKLQFNFSEGDNKCDIVINKGPAYGGAIVCTENVGEDTYKISSIIEQATIITDQFLDESIREAWEVAIYGRKRSSKWSTTRKAWLKERGSCAACGGNTMLNVHHIKPFHLFPELELDKGNLITLCEAKTHNCHLWFGHLLNWMYYNPMVMEDCAEMLEKIKNRTKIAQELTGLGPEDFKVV